MHREVSSRLGAALLAATALAACYETGGSSPTAPGPGAITTDDGKLAIVDSTGKSWDISHAVANFGMQPSGFQYGLGPFAILPILDPIMLLPGEAGYPAPNAEFLVLGTSVNGDSRAYPILTMSAREVADEVVGGAHVAVAY